ncbi:nucleoside phosphorylase [Sulfuricaulis sp.]|jgi:uridine phosphorylase|uniref:nucleoside phosphorylase n=1 Tax=Sulfuricaulis sp. TaxID=2003553 RepID=UPI0035593B7D
MSDASSTRGFPPPIVRGKNPVACSEFTPENLLREARRQKALATETVPELCILDPDGDMVRHLVAAGCARRHLAWACYHTELHTFELEGLNFGIIGCAVGAPFAVLVSEELFASGCKFLVSMTSAGQILPIQAPPYFIVIDRALRDEGTSYHYLAAADYSTASDSLLRLCTEALTTADIAVQIGATWTTDAPFRETADAIDMAKKAGILAVEMEAAALYAFAEARRKPVICIAHVTNQLGRIEGDFEKGAADGTEESLKLIASVARAYEREYLNSG